MCVRSRRRQRIVFGRQCLHYLFKRRTLIYIKHPSHHIHLVVCVDIQMPHEHILNLVDSDGTRMKIIQETHHLHQDTTLTRIPHTRTYPSDKEMRIGGRTFPIPQPASSMLPVAFAGYPPSAQGELAWSTRDEIIL